MRACGISFDELGDCQNVHLEANLDLSNMVYVTKNACSLYISLSLSSGCCPVKSKLDIKIIKFMPSFLRMITLFKIRCDHPCRKFCGLVGLTKENSHKLDSLLHFLYLPFCLGNKDMQLTCLNFLF